MIPNKGFKDWLIVIAIAIVVGAAILAPLYVIHETREESARIIAQIEMDAADRLEQAIMVNTFTISCLLAIPPEERTPDIFAECIEEGFDQAPDLDVGELPPLPGS